MNRHIAVLEEYCLNVDYTRFPVPKPLDYLFKKTTGTYIAAGKYSYEGELINGKPGGNGTIKYGDKSDHSSNTYSCTYTGTFLNGMKHGNGQLEVKGSGLFACIYQQRYSYDKKDGIFVIKYDRGNTVTQAYLLDKRQLVRKFVKSDKTHFGYFDMKDDLYHGNKIDFTLDFRINTSMFDEGSKQGSEVGWKKQASVGERNMMADYGDDD